MKKTLLAVALLMASTCGFAQVNKVVDATGNANRVASDISSSKALAHQGATKVTPRFLKSVPSNATLLCDFSDQSSFEIGTGEGHGTTATRSQWQYQAGAPAASFQFTNSAFLNTFFGGLPNAQATSTYLGSDDYVNLSYQNGLVYLDLNSLSEVDEVTNVYINTYVKFNTPIYTYGMTGVDIYLSRSVYIWNHDEYYIDWSHDANFTTYDSVQFDVRGVDVSGMTDGTICVTIPQNIEQEDGGADPNEIISTDPTQPTYFRIRCRVTASTDQIVGVYYIMDDVAYGETPEVRLNVKDYAWLNAYSRIPSIVTTPDYLWFQAVTANTGVDSLKVQVKNNLYSYHGSDAKVGYADSLDYTLIGSNISDIDTVVNAMVSDTDSYGEAYLTRNVYTVANGTSQMIGDENTSTIVESVVEYSKMDNSWDTTVVVTDYWYWTLGADEELTQTADGNNRYIWRRDNGTSGARYPMTYGYEFSRGNLYYNSSFSNYSAQGYKVCIAYTGLDYAGDVYAKGVQLVPAVDTVGDATPICEAGTAIRTSLMYWDSNATDYNSAIQTVQDEDENLIESDVYTIQAADLNTDENANSSGLVAAADLKTIYVPFRQGNAKLEPGVSYYACYTIAANGKFAVATDVPYINIFGAGYASINTGAYNSTVYSPGLSDSYQYTWGRSVYGILGTRAPMIRLVLGTDTQADHSSLNDVDAQAAAMSIYPNPAVNNTVLDYTLKNSGNVVITITDVMGRVVSTINRGQEHAGIDYRANISVNDLANGTYFCTLTVNGAKSTTKLVVNR